MPTGTWTMPASPGPARAAGSGDLDDRQEKIGYKIREAQLQKVPYMLVVGDREAAEGQCRCEARRWRPGATWRFRHRCASLRRRP
jgi:threonyl-tRNA synthetase